MTTATLLVWIPTIFFALMFAVIGILSLRNRSIKATYIDWLIGIFLFERIIEISLRTYLTKQSLAQYDPSSFEYVRLEALIGPSLRAVIMNLVVHIAIASCVWLLLYLYAKKTQFQKIDQADVLIFSLGTVIAGWPNFLIYIALVFVLTLFGLLIQQLLKKNTSRMIVTPYFALAGIIVIFWGWELSKLVGLYAIR